MRRLALVAGITALALGLAACGSASPSAAGTPAAAAPASAGAGSTASASGGPAALAYLAAANVAKLANAALDQQYAGRTLTLAESKAYYRAAAAIDASFLGTVRGITFPDNASAAAVALLNQVGADEALDEQVVGAATGTDEKAIIAGRAADLKAVAAAGNQLRADLGLPTLP